MYWGHFWGLPWGTYDGQQLQTTTQDVLEDRIEAVIRGITPSHPRHQDCPWESVTQMDDVPGGKIRIFYLEFGFPEDDPDDSIWGDGYTRRVTMHVYTNYGGLPDKEPHKVIPPDGRQLYLNLENRLDPQIPGLTSVTYLGFTPEQDEPGHVWGSHDFEIRYLAGDTL